MLNHYVFCIMCETLHQAGHLRNGRGREPVLLNILGKGSGRWRDSYKQMGNGEASGRHVPNSLGIGRAKDRATGPFEIVAPGRPPLEKQGQFFLSGKKQERTAKRAGAQCSAGCFSCVHSTAFRLFLVLG